MSSFFPLFMDISRIKVLFIGGGRIAERRIQTLRQFDAPIIVIAPRVTPVLQQLAEYGQIIWIQRAYQTGDFADPTIGIAVLCTDDRKVNHAASIEARQEGIPISVADCKEESTFYFPGIAKNGNMVVGVSSSGTDHREAARITAKIRTLLEES